MPGLRAPRPTTIAAARPPVAASARRDPAWAISAACLAAITSFLVALLLAGVLPGAVTGGLPDAGTLTRWGLPVVELMTNLAAAGIVGSLLVGAMLLPARPDGRLSELARRVVTGVRRWAAVWALLATGQLLLTVSNISAVPLNGLDATALASVIASGQGRALVVTASLAIVVAVGSGRARTVAAARVLVLAAVAAVVPTAVVGHASSAADHDVAGSAIVVHVVAATLWTGGLAGLVLHLRFVPLALATAAARFSVLALVAYVALAGSGVLVVLTRLDAPDAMWSSSYGVIVLLKSAGLAGLGVVGHLHRRRTLPQLVVAGRGGPFLRLAAVEVVVMGAAMGLATALSRTPVPPTVVVTHSHGTGHPSLPGVVEPFSVVELATAWRPNAIVAVLLGLTLSTYVVGVRRLRRRGTTWPRARTVAFTSGVLVALIDVCSGVATYAPAMVSVQVAQLLVAMLVVPVLLLLGAPATLAAQVVAADRPGVVRRRSTSPTARVAARPFTGTALSCTLLLMVYRTPLIELSQRSFWVHLLVLALAVLSGLALLWPVMGAEISDRSALSSEWVWGIVGLTGCLALLAVQLRYGDRLLAGEWFLELRWSWVDPVADQRLAGIIVALAAASLLALALAACRRTCSPDGPDPEENPAHQVGTADRAEVA